MENKQVLLGKGSYAQVKADGTWAIKTIPNNNFESAVREISLVNACDHPNVIKVVGTDYAPEETRIYMKKYTCDLLAYMKSNRPIRLDILYAIAYDLIAGIAHIHSRGIIHCDIKPENILIDLDGERPIAVICDFGIASSADEKYHSSRVQTCTYRAPEVDYYKTRIQYSCQIDMWSVGCVLFELATGFSTVKYIEGVEDSTIYACNLFELPQCNSRRERLGVLRAVNTRYIQKTINDRLSKNPDRYQALYNSGFIGLLTRCLHPNHNKRIDSRSALTVVRYIANVSADYYLDQRPFCNDIDIDDMECVVGVPAEIISKCRGLCLNLAETIYRKYVASTNDLQEEMKYGAIFIAVCIFSGSNGAIASLSASITRNNLLKFSTRIISALNNYVL